MDQFALRDGALHAEDIELLALTTVAGILLIALPLTSRTIRRAPEAKISAALT